MGWSTKRTVAFILGLVVALGAFNTFVARYGQVLFYDHMIQHLMFVMMAGPLFAMGAPAELLERATTGRTHGSWSEDWDPKSPRSSPTRLSTSGSTRC